jgi:hypothetical protein
MRSIASFIPSLIQFDELTQGGIGSFINPMDSLVKTRLQEGVRILQVTSAKTKIDLRPDRNTFVEVSCGSSSSTS